MLRAMKSCAGPFAALLVVFCVLAFGVNGLHAQTRGESGVVQVKTQSGERIKLYDDYSALVIGAGDYEHWPKLPGAVRDAREVAVVLRSLGFKVKLVLNPTSVELKKWLNELPYDQGFKADRGLLIYFAGHGETEELANHKKLGYIVPVDSPLMSSDPRGFTRTAVSMSDMEDVALRIKSRHVLMAFDSCFSGSIFALGRAAPKYITNKVAQPVRQFVTAGNEKEIVPDRSMFKRVFVDGIQGEADHDKDGYITGSELGMYLQRYVVTYTNDAQHPQFGRIRDPDLDKGDFVFALKQTGGVPPPLPSAAADRPVPPPPSPVVTPTGRGTADLEVTTTPSQAMVYLSGIRKGRSPIFLELLPKGVYQVKARKGYQIGEQEVRLLPDDLKKGSYSA